MEDVTIAFAKEHLEDLVARAAQGEDVRIVISGRDAVRLIPAESACPAKIVFGQWKHLADIPKGQLLAPLSDDDLKWLSGEASGS